MHIRKCMTKILNKIYEGTLRLLRSFESVTICADPDSFVRWRPTLTTFFLIDEGRADPNTNISALHTNFII